jgi:peptidoglycan/xylan/chitin deacetylase (PgdA/CDA1 family)
MVDFSGVCNSPRKGLRILMYHSLGSDVLGDIRGLFCTKPSDFNEQMAILNDYEYGNVVEIDSNLNDDKLNIAISFDDGYLDNLKIGAPILSKYGFPFTVFVTSEYIRGGMKSFLSVSELRELSSLPGVTIGAHGANHLPLAKCDNATIASELVSSKNFLEDILGKEIALFAYPFGSADRRVASFASEIGYNFGYCSHFDINRNGRNPLLMSRTSILGIDDKKIFLQKIKGCWDWYRWRSKDPVKKY